VRASWVAGLLALAGIAASYLPLRRAVRGIESTGACEPAVFAVIIRRRWWCGLQATTPGATIRR
jgi:hypothetical protein